MAGLSAMNGRWRGGTSRAALAAVLVAAWLAPNSTESAVANGDTRTVTFSNQHTNEAGLVHLHGERRLRPGGARQAQLVHARLAAQRADQDGPASLRHHLGGLSRIGLPPADQRAFPPTARPRPTPCCAAARVRWPSIPSTCRAGRSTRISWTSAPARIRDIAMRMQEGGVGFYPQGLTPWVHIDSGSVRYWPRMSRDALTRLFPDGKTVFIPADGQPMPGYDLAKAEIEQRGGQIQTASGGGFFAWLVRRARRRRGRRRGVGRPGGGASPRAAPDAAAAVAARLGGRAGRRSRSPKPDPWRSPRPSAACRRARPTPARRRPRPPQRRPRRPVASAPEPAPEPSRRSSRRWSSRRSRATPQADVAGQAQRADRRAVPRAAAAAAAGQSRAATRPARRRPPAAGQAGRPRRRARRRPRPSPLPPVRPAHLALLAPDTAPLSPDVTASIAARRRPRPARRRGRQRPDASPPVRGNEAEGLPGVITQGMTSPRRAPRSRWSRSPPAPAADSGALLERAAELAAPLPPMPIPERAPARGRRGRRRRPASLRKSRGCSAFGGRRVPARTACAGLQPVAPDEQSPNRRELRLLAVAGQAAG